MLLYREDMHSFKNPVYSLLARVFLMNPDPGVKEQYKPGNSPVLPMKSVEWSGDEEDREYQCAEGAK